MRKNFVRFFLFVFLVAGLVSGCTGQVKGPGIQFKSEKYDFGTVEEGKILNFAFEYANNGTEPLVIAGVLSTCSCTQVGDYDREVAPGKTGKLNVSFNTARLDGKVSRNILLGTNVPDREDITLAIEGTVKASPAAASSIEVGGSGAIGGEGPGSAFESVQTGETIIGSSASPSKQVKIVFARAFSGTPRIVATVRNDPGWDGGDAFAVTVRLVSNKQFVANIVRVDKSQPWNQSPLLDWMAWE